MAPSLPLAILEELLSVFGGSKVMKAIFFFSILIYQIACSSFVSFLVPYKILFGYSNLTQPDVYSPSSCMHHWSCTICGPL